jgi:RNA ligase
MQHPTSELAFDELLSALNDRIEKRLIKAVAAPENPDLVLYTYTRTAVIERLWDPVVELARGLIVDRNAARILARPFPKFFNYGERSAALPNEPFEVLEKLDGSLGIVFHDGSRWRVATKGSFTASQAAWAEGWLAARHWRGLNVGTTYLFEIIYATNRLVVKYGFEGLVLLGGYNESGKELHRPELALVAGALGTRLCNSHAFTTIDEVLAWANTATSNDEGFVLRFASGYRVKVKGSGYLRVHRALSQVTPLALWGLLAAGDDLAVVRREVPEEFWDDFDTIRRLLLEARAAIVATVEAEKARLAGHSDKELGMALATLPKVAQSFLFLARKGGAQWHEVARTRENLFRHFRPTNNVLPGYTPSELLSRVHAESS